MGEEQEEEKEREKRKRGREGERNLVNTTIKSQAL